VKHQLLKVMLLATLLSSSTALSIYGQYKWSVVGRAVDSCGKPVPHARVLVYPREDPGGWERIITDVEADAEGKFRYTGEDTKLVNRDDTLYVTSSYPANAVFSGNLLPPFYAVSRVDRLFTGRSLHFKSNEEVNVGDVPVQVYYGVVIVYLQDRNGKPMFTDTKDWEYIGLRIRDIHGRRVEEGDISPADVREAVRVKESAIALALPEGAWQIEIAPDGLKGKRPYGLKGKVLSSERLLVKASNSPLKVTLKRATRRK